MANEARQPDPGGTPTRISDSKAGEERPEDLQQPQGRPAPPRAARPPAGASATPTRRRPTRPALARPAPASRTVRAAVPPARARPEANLPCYPEPDGLNLPAP